MTDEIVPAIVYVLCMVTSIVCAALLFRTWARSRTRLLLWTAVSFALMAGNNLFLVLDLLVFLDVDLWPFRALTFQGALLVLLFGFIWETE